MLSAGNAEGIPVDMVSAHCLYPGAGCIVVVVSLSTGAHSGATRGNLGPVQGVIC